MFPNRPPILPDRPSACLGFSGSRPGLLNDKSLKNLNKYKN